MFKDKLYLFTLFIIGMGILIYNRIQFDHLSNYSDILDYQLVGLMIGLLSIVFLIIRNNKRLVNITFVFLILLIISLIILGFVARSKLNNYPKLF